MISEKQLDITAIILAGGKSSRMGEDKGLKLHQGIPFIQHIIKVVKIFTAKIIIITNNIDYEVFGYPCISDIIPDQGPVGGIYTGLSNTSTKQNLILSCDVPFITKDVLKNLIDQYEPNYNVITYEGNPLIATYDISVKKTFFESIQKKRLGLIKTLSTLKVKNIPITENNSKYTKNINTHQQYKEALQWK